MQNTKTRPKNMGNAIITSQSFDVLFSITGGRRMNCDICQCKVWNDEEQYRVFAKDQWWNVCALCGASAEKLGHRLVIV